MYSQDDLRKIIADADTSKDGKISFEEFIACVDSHGDSLHKEVRGEARPPVAA